MKRSPENLPIRKSGNSLIPQFFYFRPMFSINIGNKDGWRIVELIDRKTGTRAEIVPSAGAILNKFVVKGINVIDGYEGPADFAQRVHDGFRSAKLSPFVCRLNKSLYSWEGQSYQVKKFELNGSSLHGILYDAAFEMVSSMADNDRASVSLRYQYDGGTSGYPFPYNCTITYTLAAEGRFEIKTHISHSAEARTALPICDGWHPYFQLGGKADDWFLEICSDQMMEYNEELIPTGAYITNGTYYPGRIIGADKLDNGFLIRNGHSPFCTLRNDKVKIEFLSQTNYPILQLYIPDHRESIAIENLSAAPDAFNNGIGLTALKPGEKIDFVVEWKIS